ncbi:MAG: antitermination protein NusG [Pirellulaceae bacterium]|nr:antitermination protein NusG [Pirellulaceae bacterium]
MPILKEEVNEFPHDLLSECTPNEVQQWHVVYTRSRHEKSLARHLFCNSMAFYLPLVLKEQFHRGRRIQSLLPVFSNYLFYFGDRPWDVSALAPYCVSRILPVEDQVELNSELRTIHSLLAARKPMTIESRLEAGLKVRIKSGVLCGLEGTIINRKSGCRLLVAVNYLQQGVSIEIDDFMVERI